MTCHLRATERANESHPILKGLILLAVTRRNALTLVAITATAALALTGCAPNETGAAAPAGGATRTVTSEVGESTIPADPQRIVALDEPAALNLISIGITPAVVFDSWRTTVPRQILDDEGVEIVSTTAFYPEMEEVAALNPDLIVGTAAEGFTAAAPDYASIAPLIGALYTAPSADIIRAYGEYFERADEAEAVATALTELTAEVAASQPETPLKLSVLMSWAQDNMPMYMDEANSLHASIDAAAFTRPTLQDQIPEGGSAFGGWTMFSPETLPEHDADVLAIAVAAQYNLEGITGLPLYSSLAAAQNGRSVVVDGDLWSGGAAFYGYWVLRDLAGLANGSSQPGTSDDASSRWADYRAAIKG